MLEKVFVLLLIYQLKHFLADFPFQTGYMLGKFKDGWAFLLPLCAHVLVHACFTFIIVFLFTESLFLAVTLAAFDLIVHFIMDRVKAGNKYLGKYKALAATEYPSSTKKQKRHNTFFWWSLGLDQTVHHLTHYAIIACIIMQP